MITKDILKKVRHIEIYTKRLLSGALVGDTRSAIKGSGFEFDQIRDYQMGDDVRFIDWKSSAKLDKLLVKQYVEERNRTIILAVDTSGSSLFTSSKLRKWDIFQQIAAVLTLVAEYGKDRASLLLFSDEVELFIPPGRERKHTHAIFQALFSHKPQPTKKTKIHAALKHLASLKRKDAVVFLISDFIDDQFEQLLPVVSRMYDLVAVRSLDHTECAFPSVGFLQVKDLETGQHCLLDSRGRGCKALQKKMNMRLAEQNRLFKKYGIDCLDLVDHKSLMADIIRFFRRRMVY